MMKFAITISTRNQDPAQDFLSHTYVPYLEQLNILPILVPNNLSDPCAYVTALDVTGIVLSGGGDIAPERYGEANVAAIRISPDRDQTEHGLLEMAVGRNLPVLGICRGIQVLNVFFGGKLVQDIPSQIDRALDHDRGTPHPIEIVDPAIRHILGRDELEVNTYHHQGITPPVLAPELDVFAVSKADGVIEGVRHRTKPILGVQWHPERPTPSRGCDLRLFRHFLQGTD